MILCTYNFYGECLYSRSIIGLTTTSCFIFTRSTSIVELNCGVYYCRRLGNRHQNVFNLLIIIMHPSCVRSIGKLILLKLFLRKSLITWHWAYSPLSFNAQTNDLISLSVSSSSYILIVLILRFSRFLPPASFCDSHHYSSSKAIICSTLYFQPTDFTYLKWTLL